MNNEYERGFDEIASEQCEQYIKEFNARIEFAVDPGEVIDDIKGLINLQMNATHDSNGELNTVYFKLHNEARADRRKNIINLCQQYCINEKINYEVAVAFFPKLIALINFRKWIWEKEDEIKLTEKTTAFDQRESKEGEFTLLRRVLAIELLLEEAGKEISFGRTGVNKIKIAEFVDFLVSKEMKPKKDMRDTSIYDRLKASWDKVESADMDNLKYVRDQFSNIGLSNLAAKVESIINTKKK